MSITISGDSPNLATVSVTTLNAPSGVLATQNGMSGIAKAWVNFNGGSGNTAGVINNSFNVSSITVNSTGNYTVNFTTAMPNTAYACISSAETGLTLANFPELTGVVNGGKLTTSVNVICINSTDGATYRNAKYMMVAIFSS